MTNQAVSASLLLLATTLFVGTFGKPLTAVERAQSNFAVKLLKNVPDEGKSVILSPLSLSTSLYMVYLAADGKTKEQLQKVLGQTANRSQFRVYYLRLMVGLVERKNTNYTLKVANRIYVRDGLPTKAGFDRALKFYYRQKMHKFDVAQKNEVAEEINCWVGSATNNKIRDLMTADSISDDAALLLVNAIYFKAPWEAQFTEATTKLGDFHVSENEKIQIPMMRRSGEILYYESKDVKVIKLPYLGQEVEMVFILPKKRFGLSEVLKNLTGDLLLNYVRKAKLTNGVTIKIPKFRVEGKMDLKSVLQTMGITDIFSGTANFGELVEGTTPVSVSKVVQAGFIEINEKGTESAAATVIELEDRMLPSTDFIADQPFLFAIVKDLKTVLFAGKFVK